MSHGQDEHNLYSQTQDIMNTTYAVKHRKVSHYKSASQIHVGGQHWEWAQNHKAQHKGHSPAVGKSAWWSSLGLFRTPNNIYNNYADKLSG